MEIVWLAAGMAFFAASWALFHLVGSLQRED